jgi:hypothetical protein
LAPFLFNCYIDDLIEALEGIDGVSLSFRVDGMDRTFEWSCIGYADDLAVTVPLESFDVMREVIRICEDWQIKNGMMFSASKCELMIMGRVPRKLPMISLQLNGETLRVVRSFKYLGVNLRGSSFRLLDREEVFTKIEKFLTSKFTAIESCDGTPVMVGAAVVQSVFLPQLLYGCEIFPLHVKKAQRAMGKLARKVLNTYRTDSLSAMLAFLGWRRVEDVQTIRVVSFVLKLAGCRFTELRDLLLGVWDTDLTWVKWARATCDRAVECGWLQMRLTSQILCDPDRVVQVLQCFCQCVRNSRPVGHMSIRYCPSLAHFVYIFWRGHLNPRLEGGDELACVFCSFGTDSVEHVLQCESKRVKEILADVMHDGSFVSIEVTRKALRCLEELKPEQWKVVGLGLKRLWGARMKLRDVHSVEVL